MLPADDRSRRSIDSAHPRAKSITEEGLAVIDTAVLVRIQLPSSGGVCAQPLSPRSRSPPLHVAPRRPTPRCRAITDRSPTWTSKATSGLSTPTARAMSRPAHPGAGVEPARYELAVADSGGWSSGSDPQLLILAQSTDTCIDYGCPATRRCVYIGNRRAAASRSSSPPTSARSSRIVVWHEHAHLPVQGFDVDATDSQGYIEYALRDTR